MALQGGDQAVRRLHRALAGIIAPDEAAELAAEIGMHAEIVELAKVARLDRRPFFRQQRIAMIFFS